MGKSTLELAVGTGAWDAGLKKATKSLNDFVQSQGGLKSALEQDSEKVRTFVQMMGKMESNAKTLKGQMNDYKSTIEQLTVQYNQLTEAQKKTIGQDYLKSIDQLKAKFKDAKSGLDEMNKSLGETAKDSQGAGSAIQALTSQFGLSTKQLVGWGAAITAAKAALDVAKDAFFASEASLDDWNRTVYSAQSTYQGFLTALNTGDISGFLANIDSIVNAATDAYNALDALSTQKAINNAPVQAQQAENQRMRTMLQTRRYIAPLDGRSSGGMVTGQLLTDKQLKAIEKHLENGMKTLNSYTQKEIRATTNAIEALYTEQAMRLGMSKQEFLAGTRNYDVFAKNIEGANAYRDVEARKNYLRSLANSGQSLTPEQAALLNQQNPYSQYKAWGVFKDDGELYQKINELINQRAGLQQEYYGQMQQGYRAINRVEGITSRGGGGRGGNAAETLTEGGIQLGKGMDGLTDATVQTYESMASLRQKLAKYQQALDNATNVADEMAARQGISDIKWQMSDTGRAAAKIGWDRADLEAVNKEMQEAIGELEPLKIKATVDTSGIKELEDDGKDATKAMQMAAQATSALGSAVSAIEDPTAKIIALVAQGIAGVMAGAGQAMAAKDTTESGYAWIGAAATIIAEAATIAAQIHSISGYERGGIVGGNSYSGDNVFAGNAWVNSGELVLTKAQQNSLAATLQEADNRGGFSGTPYVTGENILLGLNNHLRRIGRGEIVTSKG